MDIWRLTYRSGCEVVPPESERERLWVSGGTLAIHAPISVYEIGLARRDLHWSHPHPPTVSQLGS